MSGGATTGQGHSDGGIGYGVLGYIIPPKSVPSKLFMW